MKHPQYDLIIAYANGADPEYEPTFHPNLKLRVKPTPRIPLQIFLEGIGVKYLPNTEHLYPGTVKGISAVLDAVKSGEIKV